MFSMLNLSGSCARFSKVIFAWIGLQSPTLSDDKPSLERPLLWAMGHPVHILVLPRLSWKPKISHRKLLFLAVGGGDPNVSWEALLANPRALACTRSKIWDGQRVEKISLGHPSPNRDDSQFAYGSSNFDGYFSVLMAWYVSALQTQLVGREGCVRLKTSNLQERPSRLSC